MKITYHRQKVQHTYKQNILLRVLKTIKLKKKEVSIGKIVCVGRNYAAHAEELGNEVPAFPLIFLKPASVLIHSGENIIYPDYSNEMHHEVELVLLIGDTVKNANNEKAEEQ